MKGDTLASGGKSAQFSATQNSKLSDFENDLIFNVAIVEEKYGLTKEEVATYLSRRDAGERLTLEPKMDPGEVKLPFTVTDKRNDFLSELTEMKEVVKKYPEKVFGVFTPILDRLLIKRVTTDPDEEMLSDGSTRSRKSGLITAAKYRQHSNTGVVLAAGKFVVLGGIRIPMEEVVKVGDRVTYGDYNSEIFVMDSAKVEALCDAIQMNYTDDPDGLRVVRVQDVRGNEAVNV